MHCVYLLSFTNRLKQNTPPYYYVGSKSDFSFTDGRLYDKAGKLYAGSSRYNGWKDIVKDEYEVSILSTWEEYKDCIVAEYDEQIARNAVASPEYFNLSFAACNSFANPRFALFKHSVTGKRVRLEIDHAMVLSGEYVGITKGNKLSKEHRMKISNGQLGDKNQFFGRKHTDESLQKMSAALLGKPTSDLQKQSVSKRHKGVPKSKEQRAKIGRPGLVMLKNVITLEVIRVSKEDPRYSDPDWMALTRYTSIQKKLALLQI